MVTWHEIWPKGLEGQFWAFILLFLPSNEGMDTELCLLWAKELGDNFRSLVSLLLSSERETDSELQSDVLISFKLKG